MGLEFHLKEVLFTVVSREQKYKSKGFIDTAVIRGSDVIAGFVYTGLASQIGLGLSQIAGLLIPVALVWAFVMWKLGAMQQKLADSATPHSEVISP